MSIFPRRVVSIAIPAIVLSLSIAAFAGPAEASTGHHRPAPTAPPVSAPAAAPTPTPITSTAPITVTGSVTRLGSVFNAGGYSLQTYTVRVAATGTYSVKYSVGFGGGQIRTYVDGVETGKLTGAGTDGSGISGTFTLSPGTHTIGTYSPDGYGQTDIDLVRG